MLQHARPEDAETRDGDGLSWLVLLPTSHAGRALVLSLWGLLSPFNAWTALWASHFKVSEPCSIHKRSTSAMWKSSSDLESMIHYSNTKKNPKGFEQKPKRNGPLESRAKTIIFRSLSIPEFATSPNSRTCISELRQDFFDRSVSNHISQPSSGNLAAQNALRRLVERERKGSHTLPPPQEDSQLSILTCKYKMAMRAKHYRQ